MTERKIFSKLSSSLRLRYNFLILFTLLFAKLDDYLINIILTCHLIMKIQFGRTNPKPSQWEVMIKSFYYIKCLIFPEIYVNFSCMPCLMYYLLQNIQNNVSLTNISRNSRCQSQKTNRKHFSEINGVNVGDMSENSGVM